jgi:Putative Flp pilus-assembly TadE/G-like
MADERGQIMPVLLATLTALLFGGVVLYQVGQATNLRAQAQTGADAAAIAGTRELQTEVIAQLFADWVQAEAIEAASLGQTLVPPPMITGTGLDSSAACGSYGAANDTAATCTNYGLRVHADTTTNQTVANAAGVTGGPAGGTAEACLYVHGRVTFTFPTFCDDLPAPDGPTQLNVTGMPFPQYVKAWNIAFDSRLVQVQGLTAPGGSFCPLPLAGAVIQPLAAGRDTFCPQPISTTTTTGVPPPRK